jgi:hypothetical protein
MESKMNLDSLISLALSIHDRVNFYWNLYIGGITLIVGWLLTNQQLKTLQLAIIIIGFLISTYTKLIT